MVAAVQSTFPKFTPLEVSMTKLYHSTSNHASVCIQRDGFMESSFQDIVFGVWLSDRPLNAGDGVAHQNDVCFCVDVPLNFDLSNFEAITEDKPIEGYREWIIPAVLVNSWPRGIVDEDELDRISIGGSGV